MPLTTERFKALKRRFGIRKDNLDDQWRDEWESISDYVAPHHGRFIDSRDSTASEGGKKTQFIINGTATRAAGIAAAGLKGGLTPHSLPWFKLGLYDESLSKWEPARVWLNEVQRLMYNVFSKSNFYHMVHNVYFEEINFGTGPLFVAEDDETVIHCKAWTVGEYVVSVNDRGRVDAAYRWYWDSVGSVAKRFGKEKLSPSSQALCSTNPDHYIQIIHCVFKRSGVELDRTKKDDINMPYGSVYWEHKSDTGEWLGESGYMSNPLMYPRWDVVGEDPYGSSCPGMMNLGDVKMLQKLERDKLQAISKVVDPPLMAPIKTLGRLSTLPGARNPMSTADKDAVKPLYQVAPDIGSIGQEIQNVENRIKEGYFNDLFLMMMNAHTMTATEVAQRHEDKLAILGPVIERQNSELLSPLIERVFDIMMRNEIAPPPPEELQGQELKIEYVSLLAQAQRMVGTQSIDRQLDFIGRAAVLNPDVVDTFDFDEAAEQYADLGGTPPKIVRSQEERVAIRESRAEAQQAQAQQESIAQMAATGKDLAQIPTDEENAATAMAEGMGQ